MRLLGFEITRAGRQSMSAVPVPRGIGGWWPVVREPYTGAWQANDSLSLQSLLAYPPVYACVTLIARDLGKLRLRLVEQDGDGIWTDAAAPAFSPVLRKPNAYQTIHKFVESWIVSKLVHGNAYILKQRDRRGVVVGLDVLDPCKVKVLLAPDGSVFYEAQAWELAGIPDGSVVIPAREIVHDLMEPLFHPLVGVSPLYACSAVATQGLEIQDNSTTFFSQGSKPGGVLSAPGAIGDNVAARLKTYFDEQFTGQNAGKVAVLGDGLKYEPMAVSATDAQLVEQLKWTIEQVCACFHIPAALIDSSHQPPYANSEPLIQQYYSMCLQPLIEQFQTVLEYGLGLPDVPDHVYGLEFDIGDLLWMDTKTRTEAATAAVSGGVMSPNEARERYFGLGPVTGGDSPYLQQQNFSLSALAERDADSPFSKPDPPAPAAEAAADPDDDAAEFAKGFASVELTYG